MILSILLLLHVAMLCVGHPEYWCTFNSIVITCMNGMYQQTRRRPSLSILLLLHPML